MKCPLCGQKTVVLASRPSGERVRRRRQCADCSVRFTTYEQIRNNDPVRIQQIELFEAQRRAAE